jgi:hypothetical protein
MVGGAVASCNYRNYGITSPPPPKSGGKEGVIKHSKQIPSVFGEYQIHDYQI